MIQERIRKIMLRSMYRYKGYELPGINVYLQSTKSSVKERDRGRMSTLWWVFVVKSSPWSKADELGCRGCASGD
jgi:hypothetical protein